MKLRWLGALVITIAPVACSLAIDTDGFTGGDPSGDGGSSGSLPDGAAGNPDGTTSSSGGSSGDAEGGSGDPDGGTLADGGPVPPFCSTIKPSLKLQFCDDFDDDGRTSLLAKGWSLLQGGGADELTGLSVAGEPVASGARSARIVQSLPNHARTRIGRSLSKTEDFGLHFKFYRSSFSPEGKGPPVAILQGTNCAVVISAIDIVQFCPSFASIYTYPQAAPENAWTSIALTIEDHDGLSRFYVTAPGANHVRVEPDIAGIQFNSLELGQATDDATQTVFYDDVWVEGAD